MLPANNLSGPIPTEIGQLRSLINLLLPQNQLTGSIPTELRQLTALFSLELNANRLSGTIPAEIGELTRLSRLNLARNDLSGEMPEELGNLTKLRYVYVNGNSLTGNIKVFASLWSLQHLRVSGNQFDDCVPNVLLAVKVNDLDETKLPYCGPNPASTPWPTPSPIPTATSTPGPNPIHDEQRAVLTAFYYATDGDNWTNNEGWLSDQPLATWHGVEVNYLGKVARLVLWQNNLRGTLIPEIGQLDSLVSLKLAYSQLSGPIPSEIGGLKKLETLWLQGNNLTGEIPVEVTELGKIWSIELNDNEISGPIPPSIGQMTNLEQLNLSGNRLSGPLSPEIGRATDLRFLNLSDNELNGVIPTELANLTNLRSLDLSDNNLDGAIPTELANLTNLTTLALNSNKLTGEFPEWVGSLRRLEHLRLGDNQLTGDVTTYARDLELLDTIKTVSVAGNNFFGCLPGTLRDIEETDFIFSRLNYCDQPRKQPPITPEFIKWEVGDAVRPVEERAARLGVQWLFEYAESVGWPIAGDDIDVYLMTDEPLAYAAAIEDGTIDEGEIESKLEFIKGIGGFASGDSTFNRATEEGDPIDVVRLRSTASVVIHEVIHVAFQRNLFGFDWSSLNRDYAVHPPRWFVEGMATYFHGFISSIHGGDLCRGDCVDWINGVPVSEIPLSSSEDSIYCAHACGAFAIELLASIVGQRHIVDFYIMQRPGQTWQQTFKEAFGISVPDFYARYDRHRAAGFPELNPPIVPETRR